MPIAFFLAAAASAAIDPNDILVTASLEPVQVQNAAVSATIIDQTRIEALGTPLVTDLLRLAPGVSVSTSGSRGTFTAIRIRGAESRHSLLFIDGIALNDPANSNFARFEQLDSDSIGRIEIVTGPQSALWGSEALGGVIALSSPDSLISGTRVSASSELGSERFRRASSTLSMGSDVSGLTSSVSWMKDRGIDILGGGHGDKDGFENFTASLKAVTRPGSDGELGLAARYVRAESQFDGTDPVTFLRADTADASTTTTGAIRAWARLGLSDDSPWSFETSGQYLHSENRNRDGATPLNQSTGDRFLIDAQLVRRFNFGDTRHMLIVKGEREDEDYVTRDQQYFGATDKNVSRARTSVVGEWRADWGALLSTDAAIRHDDFNRFKDATTWRANAVVHISGPLSIHAGYGEGIAQPSFIDLYGFFPGNFVGNPNLKPERSKGYEAGIRWDGKIFGAGVTAFSNRLSDEIVSVFDPVTFLSSTANASGKSRRRGIEIKADVQPIAGLRISANYTYLDAQEQKVAGGVRLKEVQRPKHSANFVADYNAGPITLGGSIAWIGKRHDTDFDTFQAVRLKSYALADARIGYALTRGLEAFVRVENAFDQKYQDVFGYATPGRTIYAGFRVRAGD